MTWLHYLPPNLQVPALYWGVLVCWCFGWILNWSAADTANLVKRAFIVMVGQCFCIFIMAPYSPKASVIYAMGTGLVSALLAMFFYDTIFLIANSWKNWIVKKFSAPTPNGPAAAVDQSMLSHLQPPPPKDPSK